MQRFGLEDLAFDQLKHILSGKNLFNLRSVSKGVKDRIESFPQTVIRLSAEGSIDATETFFSSFRGKLDIDSRYGWSLSVGWFRSLLDAICLGLDTEQMLLSLNIDQNNLLPLSESLASALRSRNSDLRIGRLCLFFRGTGRNLERSFASLAIFRELATSIELRLEILRRPPLTLDRVARHIGNLSDRFTIVETSIRYKEPRATHPSS